MNIQGKKTTLRAIEESDLILLHKWMNDPEICYMLGGWHFPSSMVHQKRWFESLQADHLNQRFAIETKKFSLIGMATLDQIDWKNNHAFHGMMLGKDFQGKGYGVDVIMAIMRYAFEELGLRRLDGSMIEFNAPSLHIYCKKCGWIIEGRKKNWYFRKNKYWDKIIVGIIREDYFALIQENNYWEIDE